MGTYLFAKEVLSNGYVYILIKNPLPSNVCFFVVCFDVITQ
jgi:hypothetical protein